jgi:outer membrane protein insertion porin family
LGPVRNLFKIDEIEIQGLRRVEKEAVTEKITSKKGFVLDNYTLRSDIQKIYALKYFESVEAHQIKRKGKNILQFIVKEKPVITQILFKGNEEIDDEDLSASMKMKEFAILDINTVKSDVESIQKQYEEKGFYLAKASYTIKDMGNDNLELTYHIKEYDKVRVKKVIFLGNRAFEDDQLKSIMETQEEGLFSFMSGTGNFKEFNFQTDVERVKYFYRTKGYLQVNIGTPEITVSQDKKWVFITMKVNEGPQFSVNDISFNGTMLFTEDKLRENIQLKKGEIYSEALLREDIQKLTEMYQDEGYAFANVLRTLSIVPGENKVDVEFSFEKGKIAYFGEIRIKGNNKTRDKVIRRELRIQEGARYSGSALRRSKENVNRLGFFEPQSVIFNQVSPKGKDDVLDIEVEVKERDTGQITLGAGYSTAGGGFLNASIAQTNFRGLGQNLSFSFSLAENSQDMTLSFTEPYVFDTKWTGGIDLYNRKDERSRSATYEQKGFAPRLGHPIAEYTRMFLTYRYEDTQIKNENDPFLDENVENGVASSVTLSIVHDKRNNTFDPSGGYYFRVATEHTGFGYKKKWQKNEFDARYYNNLYGDLVFRSRLFAAKLENVDSSPIPRSEKFFLGGARNLRGFEYEGVGPQETKQNSDGLFITRNTRGRFMTFSTFEFEHPLAREAGLRWVLFFDAGHAGEYDHIRIHKDYGFGFRWFSPIGVLRFEFGYPLGKEGEGAGSQFHFDVGQLF